MIKEAKDILEQAVSKRVPEVVIVRSAAEVSHAIMGRKFPLIGLITNPGKFDDREAKTFRYADTAAGVWKQRQVRGSRILPILLRVWAEGEDAADELFSRILPSIPRRWDYDGFEGHIVINAEEHSDCADSVSKLFLSVAEIEFCVDVATEEEIVPTINTTEVAPAPMPSADQL
jgi:hypothetical protein